MQCAQWNLTLICNVNKPISTSNYLLHNVGFDFVTRARNSWRYIQTTRPDFFPKEIPARARIANLYHFYSPHQADSFGARQSLNARGTALKGIKYLPDPSPPPHIYTQTTLHLFVSWFPWFKICIHVYMFDKRSTSGGVELMHCANFHAILLSK